MRNQLPLSPLVLAAALFAAPAIAQTYVVSPPQASTYVPLTAGTAVTSTSGTTVTLPFDFPFFGTPETQLGVSRRGYLTFGGSLTDSSNSGIPHNFTPERIIAPWWDVIVYPAGSTLWYQVRGMAPKRSIVIEWSNVAFSSTTAAKFSFQVELFEGSGRIKMSYGPTPPSGGSASVGIQGAQGNGISGLGCTTAISGGCNNLTFPAGAVIEFATPADLQLTHFAPDEPLYADVPFESRVTVGNSGGSTATNLVVRQYLSEDPVLNVAMDLPLGDSAPITLASGAELNIPLPGNVPAATSPGTWYVFAVVDPANAVSESNESNNIAVPVRVVVEPPRPELGLFGITAPAAGVPGGAFTVSLTVKNSGNADSTTPISISYFASVNPVVSVSDLPLGVATIGALAKNTQQGPLSEALSLPSTMSGGKYWIGACVDMPAGSTGAGEVLEIDETNNCDTGTTVLVNAGTLLVATTTLPPATQNAPFGERLEAVGGDGQFVWSVASGALPPGVSLSADGELTGTPSQSGEFVFEVGVASGGAMATRALTLSVQPRDLMLSVVSQTLPFAVFGRGYEHGLVAVGGRPPYRWTLTGGALPAGLAVSTDGYIAGRALERPLAASTFTVTVTDAQGAQSSGELSLTVIAPTTIRIATAKLATGYLDRAYRQELKAVGGSGTHSFSVVSFQRLAYGPTVAAGEKQPSLPQDLGLALIGQDLVGTPKKAGLYALTIRVQDGSTGEEDLTTLPLLISYTEGFQIVTTVLPDAFVGVPYNARLSHNAKSEAQVVFALPCLQQARTGADGIDFGCLSTPEQTLPAGITLGPDGSLSGTATALTDGADQKLYDFLVVATDEKGRGDLRGLTLKVREPKVAEGGCAAGGGVPFASGVLLLVAATLRRRRSSRPNCG